MSDATIFICGSVVSGIVLASTLVNFLGPERTSTRSEQERKTQPSEV